MKRRRWLVLVLLVLSALVLLLPSSPAVAAADWERLGMWEDSSDPGLLDIAQLSLWATPDRELLSFEFTMNASFEGSELWGDTPNMLRVVLDTDCREETGYRMGDGIGADVQLEFLLDEEGYYVEFWQAPSGGSDTWTPIDRYPAYIDDTDPVQTLIGVDFPAAAIGSPDRIYLDGYSRWVSPTDEEFVDWVPEGDFGEAVIAAGGVFEDVRPTHTYADAIGTLSDLGIINGYLDGTFKPDNAVWRQHFAKMIVRTLDLPVSEADVCPFSDVTISGPGDLYPDNYIAVCAARGITLGKGGNRFDPGGDITRAQLITMVVRALDNESPGLLASAPDSYTSTWGNFSTDHQAAAKKAEYNGLLTRLPLSVLNPWGAMPRGEVAQVLANVLDLLEGGTPVPL